MVTSTRSPLIEEIYTGLSPLNLFELFRHGPYCFFLDSSMDPQKLGRYSFMGSNPFLVMSSHGRRTVITEEGMPSVIKGNPFDVLGEYLEKYHLDTTGAPIPFVGGAVGYLSYDLCHFIERLPKTAVNDLKLPESYFGFYDLILAHDNLLNKTYIVSTGFPEQEEMHRLRHAQERLNECKEKLAQLPHNSASSIVTAPAIGKTELKGNFTHKDYVKAVALARQYIIDGDIFEVNISQRFEAHLTIPPYELYCRLRAINPAPFASYLGFDKLTIVSASPERFLKVQGDWVETRPIKGTVRRGKTPQEDRKKASELLSSIKDHAENMMIVDLERNDLGRVCRYGTVRVSELAILETFPTVFHLTSTVVGRLRADKSRYDLLKATFPGGSITGAPKVRSMEIIDELEPTRRSVYTGSIGYLSFDGNMDINIVIRTFLIKGNRAYFQVGGAVVYDSDPESEYQETLDKGRALISALNTAEPK
ncbi:MAG TPA: aminodeoxychorismate synthase component I [Dehalococcoidales bacterium]